MTKSQRENRKKKLRRERKRLENHILESTTGWPRPSTAEAVIRQMQSAVIKAEIMRIAAELDPDEDPRFYERNFNRNSRW